jgi:3',5'-cyclic AMP phosphodiesterase CpdA
MRLAWLTDIHLEFVADAGVEALARQVVATRPDAVLVGGDIGTATGVMRYLRRLADAIHTPIHFVLGNHDFYGGSIAAVRADAVKLQLDHDGLSWLSAAGVVPLTAATALVGHDGWGDGGFGNAATTGVMLNDFLMIDELRSARHQQRLATLGRLGEEAAEHFRAVLPEALDRFDHVVVLTHVPPFAEAAWHEGKPSDPDWLPYFACRAAGEVLKDAMQRHSARRMTVLCGHTHGAGEYAPLPNLTVLTGGAEYGKPRPQRLVEVD